MFGKTAKTPWMSRSQCEVLYKIGKTGRAGIRLWFTDINLSTIRALSKRGMVDTRKGGRIVITRAGKRRLRDPWPAHSEAAGRSAVSGISGSGSASGDSAASGEGSGNEELTEVGS